MLEDNESKATAGAGIVAALAMIGDFIKRRSTTRAMRKELKDLTEQAGDNELALTKIAASMVTKDDLAGLVREFQTQQREQAAIFTDALQAGLQHAHERIDTLFEKRA